MAILLDYLVSFMDLTLVLTRPLSEWLLDLYYRIFHGKTKPLPPISDKILLVSATQLAKKIRRREVSAVDVMNAYINRIVQVDPIINACVDNRFEEALADARAVDRLLESGIKTEAELTERMPLLGVPFTCKEIIGVKHLAQTNGQRSIRDRKAPEDSDTAALYRRAGAIPVVVTNVPTLTLWWDTWNPVFGCTKNPYNNHRSPGGSSGGESALITSAGALIGIGNDLAGSIRLPSSMCGIYGHKPSQGVISNKTSSPIYVPEIDQFVSTGPMCRYVEDLHLLVRILADDSARKLRLDEEVRFRNVKVYYIEEFPGLLLSASPDIKAAVRKAAKHFEEEHNITAHPLKIEELKHAYTIWQCKIFESAGDFVRTTLAAGGKFCLLWEYIKCFFGFSDIDYRILYFTGIEIRKKDKYYEKCLNMYNTIESKLGEVLSGNAILILPVIPEPPPHPIVTIPKLRQIGYTGIFNILGLPGTSVPAGFSKGLPIGLQVMAAKNNDHLTLAAAVELNKIFGGWKSPALIID